MVSGAVEKGEEDRGGVVCGVWIIFFRARVGAEGMVVRVGDIGVGGDFLVGGRAACEGGIQRGDAETPRRREELNADSADDADLRRSIIS